MRLALLPLAFLFGCPPPLPTLAVGEETTGWAERESAEASPASDTYLLPLAAGDTLAVRAGSEAFPALLVVNSSDGGTTQAAAAAQGGTACLGLTADTAAELMVRVAPTGTPPIRGDYQLRVDAWDEIRDGMDCALQPM